MRAMETADFPPAAVEPQMRFFNTLLEENFATGRGASGVRVTPATALASTAVLGCVRVLSESIAALPCHLYRRLPGGGKERAIGHPIERLVSRQPNSWQSSFEWRETCMTHLCLWGNAYSEKVYDFQGLVQELRPLHPSRMTVDRLENGRLRYSYDETMGPPTIYSQNQIVHLRWMSADSIVGDVPIEISRDAIGVARACEMHAARFFGNGARPGVVLETEGTLSPEAAERLRENWERVHRGPDKAQKTAILTGGLKAHELGVTNEQSQFLEARRYQTEEICRIYRVPPHMVQDLSRSSFSNIEHQGLDFVQHTLLPWIRRWESAIVRDLIDEDDKYFVEFDVRGLLRGDAATRAAYYSTMSSLGVLSINEIREFESLNPVEGGDERFVQLNMQTLANAVNNPSPQGPVPEPAPTPLSLSPPSNEKKSKARTRRRKKKDTP
jgi:HK97 family phage portal protein